MYIARSQSNSAPLYGIVLRKKLYFESVRKSLFCGSVRKLPLLTQFFVLFLLFFSLNSDAENQTTSAVSIPPCLLPANVPGRLISGHANQEIKI